MLGQAESTVPAAPAIYGSPLLQKTGIKSTQTFDFCEGTK